MLALLLAACIHAVPPDLVPDARVEYQTEDGWRIGLRRYPAEGPPVVLVHGMAANHYNWDYTSRVSLVQYLRARGWDVWVTELRGDPEAVPPNPQARAYSFDDHAILDVPAMLDTIRAQTGEDEVYWVGHSMGGMLLYTSLEQFPERIAAGVALNSPAALTESNGVYGVGRAFHWAVPRVAVGVPWMARSTLWMGRANLFLALLANPKNMDPQVANGLAREALERIPAPMVGQAKRWLREGDLVRLDGTPWFAREERPPVPLLVFGGTMDVIVPPGNAEAACGIFPACTYRELGRAHGFGSDYGHVDSVVGTTAEAEVFPLVEGFLREARRTREAQAAAPVSEPVAEPVAEPAAEPGSEPVSEP